MENTFAKYWKHTITATGVRGVESFDKPIFHSPQKSLFNYMMRSSFTDTQITLRTGHKSVESLSPEANIAGEFGKRQLSCVFAS